MQVHFWHDMDCWMLMTFSPQWAWHHQLFCHVKVSFPSLPWRGSAESCMAEHRGEGCPFSLGLGLSRRIIVCVWPNTLSCWGNSLPLKRFIIYSGGRVTEKERRENRGFFHTLIHYQDACSYQDLAGQKPGVWNSILVSIRVAGAQTLNHHHSSPETLSGKGSHVRWGMDANHTWRWGMHLPSSSLTCYPAMLGLKMPSLPG